MTEEENSSDPYDDIDREKYKKAQEERNSHKDKVEKDGVPHFFPTYRIKFNKYPLPIIATVIVAGILAYLTYVVAGVQIEGGYVSEEQYGASAGLLNGLIFVGIAAAWSFVIIVLIKKFGINVLKGIFGLSFGFLGFFMTGFFAEIILYLIVINFEITDTVILMYNITYFAMYIGIGIFTVLMIYKYFKSESIYTKNFIVIYIGLLIGAIMGVIMPLWTSLAILVFISFWDIFAVKSKYGPIKNMLDLAIESENGKSMKLSQEEVKEKIEQGELEYDTSHVEIGIGDLAFYSMLTSIALLQTGFLVVMILTAVAIIVGTGITISGLKRNKILPGLPISIFLGIGTMLLSWFIIAQF